MTAAVQLLSSLYHLCTNALIVLHCISPKHLKWPSLIISSNRSHPYAYKGSPRSKITHTHTHTHTHIFKPKIEFFFLGLGGGNKSYGSPLQYLASRLKLQPLIKLIFYSDRFSFPKSGGLFHGKCVHNISWTHKGCSSAW